MKQTHPALRNPLTWLAGLISSAVLIIVWVTQPPTPLAGGALVPVRVPTQLSDVALVGRQAFDLNCAVCHGANAAGQAGVAPPLVHRIYEPGHHGDGSFQRAVANGVRAHHWTFGDMPPIAGLDQNDVALITVYIRELQRENGIL
ncbi:MAG: cytochrome c [Pseudomonadota bacterium]